MEIGLKGYTITVSAVGDQQGCKTVMRLLDLIRRPRPPIRERHELAQFIDENAAFLVQKGIYEYSRARAGHYAKVLFAEPGFREAVERSRWQAFPLGLAMVGELVEGVLRPHAGAEANQQRDALTALVLAVVDRYPAPAALAPSAWREARADLERRMKLIVLHPPKWAKDIPEPFAKAYFNLMPIHEQLRGRDYPTTRNYLRVTMCNMHEELTTRVDAAALSERLRHGPG